MASQLLRAMDLHLLRPCLFFDTEGHRACSVGHSGGSGTGGVDCRKHKEAVMVVDAHHKVSKDRR